jgi:hypothetical protein
MASSIQNGTTEELQQTSTTTPDISKLQQLLGKIKPSSFNLKRNYSMIDISADKWLMAYDAESLQKLENPPSLADGLSRELEKV